VTCPLADRELSNRCEGAQFTDESEAAADTGNLCPVHPGDDFDTAPPDPRLYDFIVRRDAHSDPSKKTTLKRATITPPAP
jgi:hypothetical protein